MLKQIKTATEINNFSVMPVAEQEGAFHTYIQLICNVLFTSQTRQSPLNASRGGGKERERKRDGNPTLHCLIFISLCSVSEDLKRH